MSYKAIRLVAFVLVALVISNWMGGAYHQLKTGSIALPVQVKLVGVSESDVKSITVSRISPGGNVWNIAPVPGIPLWIGGHGWFRNLELSLPTRVYETLEKLELTVGDTTYAADGRDHIEEEWNISPVAGNAAAVFLSLRDPVVLHATSSVVPRFDRFLNWPGDAVLLELGLASLLFKLLVLLGLLYTLKKHEASSRDQRRRLESTIAIGSVAALVASFLTMYVPVLTSRALFPLSLEHTEGWAIVITHNWIQGHSLYYSDTGLAGSSIIYPPLYPMVSRLWSAATELTLPSLRLLTYIFQLGATVCVCFLTRQLYGSWKSGLLWLPLNLSMFDVFGWIDNAVKEPMYVFLVLAGLALLVSSVGEKRPAWRVQCIAAGVIWACAVMTKQSQVTMVGLVLLYLLLTGARQVWWTGISFAAATSAFLAACSWIWGDPYWFWTVTVPGAAPLVPSTLLSCPIHLADKVAGFFVLPLAGWALRHRALGRGEISKRPGEVANVYQLETLILVAVVGGLLVAFLSAIKLRGGCYSYGTATAILSVPLIGNLLRLRQTPVICTALLMLLPLHWPRAKAIVDRDQWAAEYLIETVRRTPGDVWIPYHSWINVVAEKQPFVAAQTIGDLAVGGLALSRAPLNAIRDRRFDLIVTAHGAPTFAVPTVDGSADDEEISEALLENYRVSQFIPLKEALVYKDGWQQVPQILWKPRGRDER